MSSYEPAIDSLKMHSHPCSIYQNNEELKQQFVPYLRTGLELGEKCVYFINENDEKFVLDAMKNGGVDITQYVRTGQFEVIHTTDAHLYGGHFGEEKMLAYWNKSIEGAQKAGFKGLRAAVEMTWALSGKPGCEILAPYESRLTKLMQEKSASVICMYSRRKFAPEKIKAIIHAHPLVITEGSTVLDNPACPPPEEFDEGSVSLDIQAILDNLELIRELRQAKEDLQQSLEEVTKLNDELYQVAYIISHELQQPVTSITSYSKLLVSRYTDRLGADANEFLATLEKSARMTARMVDDLWTYARVTKPGRKKAMVNLGWLLEQAISDLKPLIESRSCRIKHCPFHEFPTVECNQEQIAYVIHELITNAIKHNPAPERPVIEISAEQGPDGCTVVFKDNGPGIDAFFAKQVFSIYQRLNRKPDENGTGMGLPICKKIIEHEHKGAIGLHASGGAGGAFYFWLPTVSSSRQVASVAVPKSTVSYTS